MSQFIDINGSKSVFVASVVLTALYYAAMSRAREFAVFMLIQFFKIGYHFDAGAEMYMATVTTERERTLSALYLALPQAVALLIGPILAAKTAVLFSIRFSELMCAGKAKSFLRKFKNKHFQVSYLRLVYRWFCIHCLIHTLCLSSQSSV